MVELVNLQMMFWILDHIKLVIWMHHFGKVIVTLSLLILENYSQDWSIMTVLYAAVVACFFYFLLLFHSYSFVSSCKFLVEGGGNFVTWPLSTQWGTRPLSCPRTLQQQRGRMLCCCGCGGLNLYSWRDELSVPIWYCIWNILSKNDHHCFPKWF